MRTTRVAGLVLALLLGTVTPARAEPPRRDPTVCFLLVALSMIDEPASPWFVIDSGGDVYLWDPFGLMDDEVPPEDAVLVWDCPPYASPPS